MDSGITEEERREFEAFIAEHEPYADDDPVWDTFDNPEADEKRMRATIMKKLLTGELAAHGPEWKPPT